MFRSKRWLTVLIVLMLVSITFSPALAQSTPPGNTPTLGDIEPVDPTEFTALPVDYVPGGEISVDVTAPAPNYPFQNIVMTRTPKFYFTPRIGASQYHVVVVDTMASPDKVVAHVYGTGSCTKYICYLQSSTALKTLRFEAASGGLYSWYVEAMVGGSWQGLSSGAMFAVGSSGFTQDFNLNTKKWVPLSGTWTRTDKGYYKGVGPVGTMTSALQKELFTNDYVYEVTFKRKVEADSFNRIIFMGMPTPLSSDFSWYSGYYFGYYNSGTWELWRRDAGTITVLYDNVPSPFIEPYGWNTLTVWTDYPNIHMWINGGYLGYIFDDTYASGFVGVGMYENFSDSSPVLVNSAKLYYTNVAPYAITDAVLGEPLNIQVEGERVIE
jgi:hypothetical protein